MANLQTYVARLRRGLPPGARILTRGSGYVLRTAPEEVDLLAFDEEVRQARLKAERGEARAAIENRRVLRAGSDAAGGLTALLARPPPCPAVEFLVNGSHRPARVSRQSEN
ncbi:hypothetical protein AB0L65_01245 [Nonomuraea sp. NPDC052116]|uniref:AfsR/SARP family transcriptional regulator n=1 Tax=Nonomuraea sp. NPDC052116 TaxID=3155665 RepID=UPI00342C2BA0